MSLNRSFDLFADGQPVTGYSRAWLTGQDALGLLPMPFTLRLWNLADSDYYLLSSAGKVSVRCEGSVLASGKVSDVYRQLVPEGTLTEVVFSPGLALWDAQVSLSVEAGASVSETVRQILEASGTGISLLSWVGEDTVRLRGQAFFGRAAECVDEALSAAGARAFIAGDGLCMVPEDGLPVSMELTEADLLDAPIRVAGNRMVLRTRPVGWPLGKKIRVEWKGETATGLIKERSIDADTMEGNWQAELLVEVSI